LIFTRGPLFYAFFNLRLFFFLLFRRTDVLVANDLDTLLANYLISRIKNKPLVYDSHEYFTEVPELQGRYARRVWLAVERWIFPKLRDVITVNESIAGEYEKRYGLRPRVVRNLPECEEHTAAAVLSKKELDIAENQAVIILQGSGINRDRGGEEAVMAMEYVDDAVLLVVGGGDALPQLKKITEEKGLQRKLRFIPRQSPGNLYAYTALADVGLSLDKDTNLNYRYSLPNKIFDYIRCGVPVLASNLPEVASVIRGYGVGRVVEDYSVENIAATLRLMIRNRDKELLQDALKKAARDLCWEKEKAVVEDIYRRLL